MATWHHFIGLLNQALGTENVEGGLGPGDRTAVAGFEQTLTLKDGTSVKRRQKLHFEYDGKDTGWIAVTSFIGPVDTEDLPSFLEFLGNDASRPAAVIADGELALRHHFDLAGTNGQKSTDDADKAVLAKAFIAAVALGSFADVLEGSYFVDDVS
ncbi:hypothetical protein [Embleya sp. NPDC020630]|uniref:hypothetical protein n=1 Tax=Embleya sp. NPDC020630 TaxID=3363979 RepID=UPI0037A3889C